MQEDALEVATDPNYKFDLAIQLGKLDVAKVGFLRSFAINNIMFQMLHTVFDSFLACITSLSFDVIGLCH